MVCGTDGFVETWAGGIVRTRNADGKKTKLQGPIDGSVRRQRVFMTRNASSVLTLRWRLQVVFALESPCFLKYDLWLLFLLFSPFCLYVSLINDAP